MAEAFALPVLWCGVVPVLRTVTMSKDFSGARAVAGARARLDAAVSEVTAAAGSLSRRELRRSGRGAPRAVRRLREVAAYPAPGELEEAAWAVVSAVESRQGPAARPEAMLFVGATQQLETALDGLRMAREAARKGAGL